MNNKLKGMGLILICMMGFNGIGYSQSTYKIDETKEVNVKLLGTSTLHDWEMDANSATGEAQFIFKSGSESELTSLKSLWFAMEVKDLKSDSKALDENAYEALKSDEYKSIQYKLSSSTLSPEKEGYLLKANGILTIAGIAKEIVLDVHSVVNENGTITCKGSYTLKMTDYEVDPPSFMWGAMKTGNAITLEFNVVYKNQKGA